MSDREYSINTITYYTNRVSRSITNDFLQEGLDKPKYNKIISIYSKVFTRASVFNLSRIFVTLTQSDSIFFRLKSDNNKYEFKLEVFFDYDEYNEEDIESTLHIYKEGEKQKSLFGSVDYLCDEISRLLTFIPTYEIISSEEIFCSYNTYPNIETISQEMLSPTFIASQGSRYNSFTRSKQLSLSGQMG